MVAIVRGRKLYGSDKLAALAREDDRAVAEYAYLMAGLSDDWGRFKLSPRRILGDCYEHRPNVTEMLVADWLSMFEKHGLLKVYANADGCLYGEWTNYMGDPESRRRYHSCPEPEWSTHRHTKNCEFYREAKQQVTPYRTKKPRKSSCNPSPPVPSVPPVPTDKTSPVGEVPKPRETWLTEYANAYHERWGGESEPPFGEMASGLKKAEARIGREEALLRWRRFLAGTPKAAFCKPALFLQSLGEWSDTHVQPPARASPKAKARDDADAALLRAGLKGENGDGRGVDQRHGAARGVLPEPRGEPGAEGDSGPDVS